ncbi:MAG TPA: PQQ-dependent dehydrogenase, methanol/ethanol family, partial [Kofleriaceae bacterium]|nr:PQQ-dependent dehydrogenase, methanol/ethanol family [Kofleriaceae bacterium]
MHRVTRPWSIIASCALVALACTAGGDPGPDVAAPPGATVDDAALVAADTRVDEWIAHGRTYDEQRYSPLDQITTANVSQLGLAWSFDPETNRGLEATPIVVDGVMYTTGSWSVVFALDAATGELRWQYDPKVDKAVGRYACCDVVNRGVAVYRGRVYVGVLDGRLVALDAATGSEVWSVQTTPQSEPYTITGAPRIVKGRVLIGNGGAEYGVRGYLSAYDTATGEMVWRFYTVPGNPADGFESAAMERAAATWTGEWWTMGGGGTVWDSMAYDPVLDLLYVGTGNGSPWNREARSPGGGDNLYLSSIVALRPDTGELVWHYQTTPGDTWDYTATQHIVLAELTIDGQERKALMQAPKNGFFYVLDRVTGELISAQPYVQMTWATGVDMATGRPIENPEARYVDAGVVVLPSPYGGHNWHPMAFHPGTGLVYIPALEIPGLFGQQPGFVFTKGTWNTAVDFSLNETVPPELVSGHLLAWDPVAQKEAWRVAYELPWSGGVLATAGGLVFQGTFDGNLNAYDARSGDRLWHAFTGSGVVAPPITYRLGDKQFVAVMSGWGGAFALVGGDAARAAGVEARDGRLVVFALGASGELPARRAPEPPVALAAIPSTASAEQVREGFVLFNQHCAVCHGIGAVGGGVLADLRTSEARVFDGWGEIVLDGRYEDRGMPGFSQFLDPD